VAEEVMENVKIYPQVSILDRVVKFHVVHESKTGQISLGELVMKPAQNGEYIRGNAN
jgi:hypothetical protein